MRQDNQTWDATHTLVITTNHEIYIPAGDDGTWRRLVIINFPYRFVTEPTLPNDRLVELGLRDRLRAGEEGQHEAVLAWLVQGAMKWFAKLNCQITVNQPAQPSGGSNPSLATNQPTSLRWVFCWLFGSLDDWNTLSAS